MVLYCFSHLVSLSLSYFFIFDVVDRLELREISTSRFGLSSCLYAVCNDCGLSEFLWPPVIIIGRYKVRGSEACLACTQKYILLYYKKIFYIIKIYEKVVKIYLNNIQ